MGNTVGSLSDMQQQIILGCLLGDGYMRRKTNAHLQITHSVKQKAYVDWKYQILKNLVLSPPKQYKGNVGRIGYRFFTRSLPELTPFHKLFYKEGLKIVPKGMVLSPLTLAVWYMDDGSKSGGSCYLNTQHFNNESQNNLIESLNNIGIKATLNKDKHYLRIRLLKESSLLMANIIRPYIIESMFYKLPI